MPSKPLKFPAGFLWGAGTSAFQVEGNNSLSDWWTFDSGQSIDHYHRFQEDFSLARSLGHNAHRLSLEWSRIEPLPGVFDLEAIEHYRQVLQSLKNRNLQVFLTLHHFSNPIWFSDRGGWESGKSVGYFIRFISRVVPEFKHLVDFWITINEPSAYAYAAYNLGKFPPQKRSFISQGKVLWNMSLAHRSAYQKIHQLIPKAKVGMTQNVTSYTLTDPGFVKNWQATVRNFLDNHLFYVLTTKCHDFLGLNYYFNRNLDRHPQPPKRVSDLGWEIKPTGIYQALVELSQYKLPIYITENGLAARDDRERVAFLSDFLAEVHRSLATGVDIRGYLHWSLLDNYEWAEGFSAKFGLIGVDLATLKRTPKPSAYFYRDIIRSSK